MIPFRGLGGNFGAGNCHPDAFVAVSCNRNILTGPGLATWDFSLVKNNNSRRISESFNVQFRAEFVNILNRPNFAAPINNSTLVDQNAAPQAWLASATVDRHRASASSCMRRTPLSQATTPFLQAPCGAGVDVLQSREAFLESARAPRPSPCRDQSAAFRYRFHEGTCEYPVFYPGHIAGIGSNVIAPGPSLSLGSYLGPGMG
jgi:hypothetical protein